MKRVINAFWAVLIALTLCGCGAAHAETTPAPEPTEEAAVPAEKIETPETPDATVTPEPTAPPRPITLELPEPEEGWAESYLAFIDNNYDIIAALWPEGLTGVGFIDLDLDGTPEMVVFDQGASATLGVQLFDLKDGQVYCVSSVLEGAAGAFGEEYFSDVSVCASFFEAFRLSRTAEGYCFWVSSANGTMESSWDELVRFDCADGVLTPVSVCARFLECDPESGQVTDERYTVDGKAADADAYQAAAAEYTDSRDTGYEAKGVFLWTDMSRYDTTYDGLTAMARDAAEAYEPIAVD